MEKLAKMAMLDVKDAHNAKRDIEKMVRMAEILTELDPYEAIEEERAGALRPDEVKDKSLTWEKIIVPKVVGE
ncbi:MAG: hypothetical protein IKU60_03625 [Clostridia bacterium]|nr:hypothetical protein [Clostridia bacterium]